MKPIHLAIVKRDRPDVIASLRRMPAEDIQLLMDRRQADRRASNGLQEPGVPLGAGAAAPGVHGAAAGGATTAPGGHVGTPGVRHRGGLDAGATTLAVPNSIAQGVPREPRTIDEMVAALTKTLGHDDFRMHRNAASSLGNFGPEARSAVPALARLLRDPEASVRLAAAEALGRIGSAATEARPALESALTRGIPEGRQSGEFATESSGR